MVLGDRGRIGQIVSNLVTNALKCTPEGGSVEVRLVERGVEVDLVARDNGKGIAPEILPGLFDLTVRDRTYATSRNGLGVGLYIVRRLVELQHGTVIQQWCGPWSEPGISRGARPCRVHRARCRHRRTRA